MGKVLMIVAPERFRDEELFETQAVLAAVILANAGLLAGKHATVAGTEALTLEAAGARYSGPGVTVDGKLVIANGPKSSHLFGERIAELLAPVTPSGTKRPGASTRPRRSREVRA